MTQEQVLSKLIGLDANRYWNVERQLVYYGHLPGPKDTAVRYAVYIQPGLDGKPCSIYSGRTLDEAAENAIAALNEYNAAAVKAAKALNDYASPPPAPQPAIDPDDGVDLDYAKLLMED